ncbi:MAG: phytanoyl-CoA dioxygenase [Proteobacteria bacterium]|jgi:ectoine hydroxylase-related dioxygenase (phytanoyl-CoA dioxygenase family)|nr:phytanoyl-CoA dioxygenase [Pseudomonadota bacterium]MBP10190.1 phytanoyl-CoA dioxygenase [Acidiferrobacteraceae bacterium]MDP6098380.1 phytanoyl-CoA dioxygenase family protein [Gammaproteobacteria bacterium]MDP7220835.1 phytanoyl-CoA dioxygenase family protein [Arenicellales bacterium]HCF74227.1 phytanoyl-CoA dioxygenase [Gammaproteobacteria bacterium]|tara:strand:- start:1227 stop:2132 length:906 start_codon:yes stop_codon:yes gene_type:complete
MLEADVLKYPTRSITSEQREAFFANGSLVLESFIGNDWLARLRHAASKSIESARHVTENNATYVLESGHSPEAPALRRLNSPVCNHPDFWRFACESSIVELAADLCGPHVKFYHSKLNFKWPHVGQKFDWHQDIPAWPHTDYSPVTIGLYLEDCGVEQGPLMAINGTHRGDLHSMYDENHNWVLRIPEENLESGWQDHIVNLTGPAGSVVVLNCRVIHGSHQNNSTQMRPLLLNVYSSADSMPYAFNPLASEYDGVIVCGEPARYASHDPRGCELPPDWSKGYVGPWQHQATGRAVEEESA